MISMLISDWYLQQAINKEMRKLRVSRRKIRPARTEHSINARDIILNIFSTQTDAQKLEYSKSNWTKSPGQNNSSVIDSSIRTGYQPLRYLMPFLENIANGVDIDTCSYLFVDGNTLKVVYKEKKVYIEKVRFSCSRVKYWLSHIYFYRFRNKLAQNLLEEPKNTARETINIYEEKEYMPKILRGVTKQSAPFIRKIKVSQDGNFRRNSQAQKQPFCIVYNKNGSQQEFTFSEVLSFVDYSFNLKDIIYIKIIPLNQRNSIPLNLRYSKLNETKDQAQKLLRFRSVFGRVAGWQAIKDQMDQRKSQELAKENYDAYCSLQQLEAIAYIEVNKSVAVTILDSSWVLSKEKGVIMTNVSKFTFTQAKIAHSLQGLQTLYNKKLYDSIQTPLRNNSRLEASIRNKRIKSQQPQRAGQVLLFNLPLYSIQKEVRQSSRLQSHNKSPFKSKLRVNRLNTRIDNEEQTIVKSKGKSLFRGLVNLFT